MSLTCSTISLNIKATVTLLPSLRLGDYELNQWRQSKVVGTGRTSTSSPLCKGWQDLALPATDGGTFCHLEAEH